MQRGAALLISVIILGALFVIFVIVSVQGVVNETSVLQALTYKKTADAHARACLDIALYRFASNDTYAGNEAITLTEGVCTIRPIFQISSEWIIETEATVSNRTSRLRATLTQRTPAELSSVEAVVAF
jgi:hypothetical protein